MNDTFTGRVWTLGDDIDTDIIIPTEYLALKTVQEMAPYAFSPLRPELAAQIRSGDILVVLPGQLHSIDQADGRTMEYENIIFHTNMLFSRQEDVCFNQYFLPLMQRQIQADGDGQRMNPPDSLGRFDLNGKLIGKTKPVFFCPFHR